MSKPCGECGLRPVNPAKCLNWTPVCDECWDSSFQQVCAECSLNPPNPYMSNAAGLGICDECWDRDMTILNAD